MFILQLVLVWQVQVMVWQFDLGQLFVGWDGVFDVEFVSSGVQQKQGLDVMLDLCCFDGMLWYCLVCGCGWLYLLLVQVFDGIFDFVFGGSIVYFMVQLGVSNDVEFILVIVLLVDWLFDVGGCLDGYLVICGKVFRFSVNGIVYGQCLVWQQQKLDMLQLIVGIFDISVFSGKFDLDVCGLLVFDGLVFDCLYLFVEGSQVIYWFILQVDGCQLLIDFVFDGLLKNGVWSGMLGWFDFVLQGLLCWCLQQLVVLSYCDGVVSIGELCFIVGDLLLCVFVRQDKVGNFDVNYWLCVLLLVLIFNVVGMVDLLLCVDGSIEGDGQLCCSVSGVFIGYVVICLDIGIIIYIDCVDWLLLVYCYFVLQV